MPVPIPLLAAVGAILVLLLLFIIYKILQKRRTKAAATESSEKPSKNNDYQLLEEGEQEFDQQTDEDGNPAASKDTKSRKKKKRKNKRGSDGNIDLAEDGMGQGGTTLGIPVELLKARLQLSVCYSEYRKQLLVSIHKGGNIGSGPTSNSEVRITILPSKTQRFKTKCELSTNPLFEQFFTFDDVFPEDFQEGILRVRCYILNGRRRVLIGESRVELFSELGHVEGHNFEKQWREFTPATELIPDDISDTEIVTDPESCLVAPKEKVPMLLISLQHKSVTGKLTVEIIKARHMITLPNQKSPETFVEMLLLNLNGGEVGSARTAICKGSFHPAFNESFYFPAIEFELDGLTLVVSVFSKKFRKKDLLGRFRIGRESTGEREQLHWDLMMEARGEPIQGWYNLTNEG